MKTSYIKAIAGVALVLASGIASAQLGGFAKSLGVGGGGNVSAEQIVTRYVGAAQSVMRADAGMLAAVGLKDEAEKASVQAKNLTEGATSKSLEEAGAVQTASSAALEKVLKGKNVEMDAASKQQFAGSLVDLAKGLVQYVGVSKEASGFKPGVSSLGSSAGSALYIVKNLPDSVKNLGSTLKLAIEFAKANNIPVPKEANDATALL